MSTNRRAFIRNTAWMGVGAAFAAAAPAARAEKKIAGFDETSQGKISGSNTWPIDPGKKVKVGIAGNGVCRFGKAFGFQYHPNVEVVAVAELNADCLKDLQDATHAPNAYASCEEMIAKQKDLEAVFIATDAKSHIDLVLLALSRGLHAASAVPCLFGDDQLDKAPLLLDAVKKSGKKYAMFETSGFHHDVYAMREIFKKGDCGKLVYTEGEYIHYSNKKNPIGSYKNWRTALPPQWYPTHSNGYYTCVGGGWFTHVTCIGMPSISSIYNGGVNQYKNPYGSETALFQTSEGGAARMAVIWDVPSQVGREAGRWFTQYGFTGQDFYGDPAPFLDRADLKRDEWNLKKLAYKPVRPQLPAAMLQSGDAFINHHGGSHGHLTCDFIEAILTDRQPMCDAACALNTTVSGIYAHRSAMKDGERLAVPHFTL